MAGNSYLQNLLFLVTVLPLSLIWAFCFRYFGKDIYVFGSLRRLLRIYADSDIVVAAGGGYIYTTSKTTGNVILLLTLFSFYIGTLLRKPVYIYSQSIGPFATNFQARLARRMLSKARLIELREEHSLRLLEKWNMDTPLHLVEDAAFLVPDAIPVQLPEKNSSSGSARRFRVGLTVRKWFRTPAEQLHYEKTIAVFVDWLIDDLKASVYFIPQVTYKRGSDDDREAARDVCSLLRTSTSAHRLEEEYCPRQIKGLCSEMDFFVGTRMHSNIFALSMKVPTLAISYQPKTDGIMSRLELSRFTLPIDHLNLPSLQEKFRLLEKESEAIRDFLEGKIIEIRDKATGNGRLIESDYCSLIRR
jgi:colanic acid/amylovoran biosynthesis protein